MYTYVNKQRPDPEWREFVPQKTRLVSRQKLYRVPDYAESVKGHEAGFSGSPFRILKNEALSARTRWPFIRHSQAGLTRRSETTKAGQEDGT